jgi:ParB-like chromosome segregation protein Spo0J
VSTATITKPVDVAGDPKIEAWLTELHVEFTFEPALELSLIDMRKSLANQARVDEPLIKDVVEMYELAYRDGAQFPPIICRRTSARARLYNLDGNHRASAAIAAGVKTHPAYVVECADEAALAIMYEGNLRNGAQLPRAQRVAQAAHLVATGMDQLAAAKTLRVAPSEVSNYRKVQRTSQRCHELGVPQYDAFPMSVRLELAKLDSDPRLAEATKLVKDAGLAGDDVRKLVDRVRKAGSDDKALELLGSTREERRHEIQKNYGGKATTRRARRTTEFDLVSQACMTIKVVQPADVDESAPTPEARRRMRELLKATAQACMAIDKALA